MIPMVVWPCLATRWWRDSCYLIDHIHRDVMTSTLLFRSQETHLLCRSVDLASFYGQSTFQKNQNYSFALLKHFFCFLAPHDGATKLQLN